MKKFIKNHKKACIIGTCIFLLIIIILLIILLITPSFGGNSYGNRLDDIESHKVSSKSIEKIKETIKETEGVTKVTYHKEGRILNFIIEFDEGYNIDSAKTCANNVIENISEKNLEYYDVQIFVDADSEGFPNIGYYAKGSGKITWGNVGENSES